MNCTHATPTRAKTRADPLPQDTDMEMIAQEDAIVMIETPQVKTKLKMDDLVKTANIAPKLTKEEREALGKWVVCGYKKDMQSRREWEERNAEAIKLAL